DDSQQPRQGCGEDGCTRLNVGRDVGRRRTHPACARQLRTKRAEGVSPIPLVRIDIIENHWPSDRGRCRRVCCGTTQPSRCHGTMVAASVTTTRASLFGDREVIDVARARHWPLQRLPAECCCRAAQPAARTGFPTSLSRSLSAKAPRWAAAGCVSGSRSPRPSSL
ncbi:MAG: hypothetical protein QOH20_4445, partial [Mycobacterium sp.]|nr:hypothetical protein [Mycobacterium sp.]